MKHKTILPITLLLLVAFTAYSQPDYTTDYEHTSLHYSHSKSWSLPDAKSYKQVSYYFTTGSDSTAADTLVLHRKLAKSTKNTATLGGCPLKAGSKYKLSLSPAPLNSPALKDTWYARHASARGSKSSNSFRIIRKTSGDSTQTQKEELPAAKDAEGFVQVGHRLFGVNCREE